MDRSEEIIYAPNVSLPLHFQYIMKQINHELDEYANVVESAISQETKEQMSKMHKNMDRIATALTKTEKRIMDRTRATDDLKTWIEDIAVQKKLDQNTKEQDTNELNSFILQFGSNTNQLKSLETDLIAFLRTLTEEHETPTTIRLNRLFKQKHAEYTERSLLNDNVAVGLDRAEKKCTDVMKEHDTLMEENEKANAQLESFTGPLSHNMIQRARRKKMVIEEWNARREELLKQIQETTEEYRSYLSIDKTIAELTHKSNEQESEYRRKSVLYQDELRVAAEEATVSHQNEKATLSQLEKDLEGQRSKLISFERNSTHKAVQSLKTQSDRELSKIRSEKSAKLREMERALKRKTTEMKMDDFFDIVNKYLDADTKKLETRMSTSISNIKEVIDRYQNILSASTESALKKIHDTHNHTKELLKTSQIRINQRISERNLEIISLSDALVTMHGVIEDFELECSNYETSHTTLQKELHKINEEKDLATNALKKEIEDISLFITKANTMIVDLTETMNTKIEEASTNKLRKMLAEREEEKQNEPEVISQANDVTDQATNEGEEIIEEEHSEEESIEEVIEEQPAIIIQREVKQESEQEPNLSGLDESSISHIDFSSETSHTVHQEGMWNKQPEPPKGTPPRRKGKPRRHGSRSSYSTNSEPQEEDATQQGKRTLVIEYTQESEESPITAKSRRELMMKFADGLRKPRKKNTTAIPNQEPSFVTTRAKPVQHELNEIPSSIYYLDESRNVRRRRVKRVRKEHISPLKWGSDNFVYEEEMKRIHDAAKIIEPPILTAQGLPNHIHEKMVLQKLARGPVIVKKVKKQKKKAKRKGNENDATQSELNKRPAQRKMVKKLARLQHPLIEVIPIPPESQ